MILAPNNETKDEPEGHNQTASTSSMRPPVLQETQNQPSPIGSGAFGIVWSSMDHRLKKQVAIKEVRDIFVTLTAAKRLLRELTMLSAFKHENLLHLITVQPLEDSMFNKIWFTTELMETDLNKLISSPQPISVEHIQLFTYQMLRGLKYLHSANIIHRDIKPGNLLVKSNCLLKICDFGMARYWDPRERIDMTYDVVTQFYRAPEVLLGCKKYTTSVDIWSVGCILAEMILRTPLFSANTMIEQLDLIMNTIPMGQKEPAFFKFISEPAKKHINQREIKPRPLIEICQKYCIPREAYELLVYLLIFDMDQRISADQALTHPFLESGRERFHTVLCDCCPRTGEIPQKTKEELEPKCEKPFHPQAEQDLAKMSVLDFRRKIIEFSRFYSNKYYKS